MTMKKKNIIERILAETPTRNKVIGQVSTIIGVFCAFILTTDYIQNEEVKLLVTFLSIVLGGNALYNAQKVKNG